jgi:hypothetical protein
MVEARPSSENPIHTAWKEFDEFLVAEDIGFGTPLLRVISDLAEDYRAQAGIADRRGGDMETSESGREGDGATETADPKGRFGQEKRRIDALIRDHEDTIPGYFEARHDGRLTGLLGSLRTALQDNMVLALPPGNEYRRKARVLGSLGDGLEARRNAVLGKKPLPSQVPGAPQQ